MASRVRERCGGEKDVMIRVDKWWYVVCSMWMWFGHLERNNVGKLAKHLDSECTPDASFNIQDITQRSIASPSATSVGPSPAIASTNTHDHQNDRYGHRCRTEPVGLKLS
ncbi:hypothetical protein EVAR_31524_1 [Eumeta japonica]|uniref:Uncharacterized protein n=1 Tax=Eumeta variegata TaxID=151549 RepID=A0A4C1Z1U7_EUMVA|nr:hypothetical protein EVAR_31524_1 [Eumeta japonica]